jgi:hypothetical protein
MVEVKPRVGAHDAVHAGPERLGVGSVDLVRPDVRPGRRTVWPR